MAAQQGPVVIVGAGQAGGWVALTVRSLQPDRPVILIGDEHHPPYERPPLSKDVLAGKAAPESTYLKPLAHYAESGIDLRLGSRVAAIAPDDRTVTLSTGEQLGYGQLVLATGMSPRQLAIPGADHPRVRTLRSMQDLAPIRQLLAPGHKVVCIGAGFIGLEIAAVAARSGCTVTVLEAAPVALGRVISPEVSAALVRRHERNGVAFRFGANVISIQDKNGMAEIELAEGDSLAADLVIVGIGGMPNCQLAEAAGIECDNGISVDAEGRTSEPSVYAAGDVCRQFSLALGRTIRLESWQNAQNQAIAVGKHIAGVPEPYADLPWFWTDQYDDNFQIIGAPERWDRVVWRGMPDDDKFTAIYLDNGRVVAGNTLNNARDIRPLRQMIIDRAVVDPEVLQDTETALIKIQKLQAAI
ncbi:NAD(FAD)-dependent dehydrogenase [Devosia sp. 17-2-E-8]|nr:NAD(FAD)-dependent dehydrogenase [Devosia sp. 17-2-E-8]